MQMDYEIIRAVGVQPAFGLPLQQLRVGDAMDVAKKDIASTRARAYKFAKDNKIQLKTTVRGDILRIVRVA
jgi:hypothetical protein